MLIFLGIIPFCDKAGKEDSMKLLIIALAFLAPMTLTGCTGDKEETGTTQGTDSADSGV